MRWISAPLILGSASLFSCSSQPDEGGEWVSSAVAPFVVRIEGSSVLCSGAKVGPRIFLTARHCLASFSTKPIELAHADGANQVSVMITEVVTAPAETSMRDYDLAFLVVDRDSPQFPVAGFRVTPGAMPRPVTAYGFGCDEDRLRRLTLQTIPDEEFTSRYRAMPAESSIARFYGPDALCEGDSGGPVVDSDGTVLGVLSRVNENDTRHSVAAKPNAPMGELLRQFKEHGENPAWADLQIVE